MSSIFLNHTDADKPFVRRLAQDLQKAGIRVWLDEAEMLIGDSLIEKIRQGIDDMEYLGVVLSPNSVNSEWVKREVDIAMNQEIEGKRVKVLPLRIRDCEVPGFLKGKVYADFRHTRRGTKRYKDELARIIRRLEGKNISIKDAALRLSMPFFRGKIEYVKYTTIGNIAYKLWGWKNPQLHLQAVNEGMQYDIMQAALEANGRRENDVSELCDALNYINNIFPRMYSWADELGRFYRGGSGADIPVGIEFVKFRTTLEIINRGSKVERLLPMETEEEELERQPWMLEGTSILYTIKPSGSPKELVIAANDTVLLELEVSLNLDFRKGLGFFIVDYIEPTLRQTPAFAEFLKGQINGLQLEVHLGDGTREKWEFGIRVPEQERLIMKPIDLDTFLMKWKFVQNTGEYNLKRADENRS